MSIKLTNYALLMASMALLIQGCGGGSSVVDGGSNQPVLSVAAVGAPISLGTISAIDKNGQTASTDVAADGSYSLSFISGLTAPVLLRVEGVSGGRTIVHFGVATSTSLSVVNVTPVSTAVVAQVMQADPGTVFATADTAKIALLTQSQVEAASNIIGAELAAARSAAGLSGTGSLDFLNTAFSADKTGLDKVLDLVRVSVQPDRSIQLKNKTDDGVTTVGTNGSVSGSLGTIASIDTKSIDTLGASLQAAFQNGAAPWLSASPSVLNLFSSDFLHGGEGRSAVIASLAQEAEDMRGAQFLPGKVVNCASSAGGTVCEVQYTIRYTDGAVEVFTFPVRQEGSAWKLYGDQAPTSTQYGAVVYRTKSGTTVNTRSGFNIQVYDDASIGGTPVGFVKIWFGTNTSGTADGVFVNPNPRVATVQHCGGNSAGYLEVLTDVNNVNSCAGNFIELTDTQIGQLRSNFSTSRPKITVRYYDAAGNRIGASEYVITVESLPLKTTEVTDGHFAVINDSSWTQFAAANLNTQFTLSVTKGPNVGLEDVVGAGPLGTTLTTQNLPYSTIRTGTSWSALKANSSLITVTRDADGRMYWYQRQ